MFSASSKEKNHVSSRIYSLVSTICMSMNSLCAGFAAFCTLDFSHTYTDRELVESFVAKALKQVPSNNNRLFVVGGFKDDFRFKEVLDQIL